MDYKCVKRCFDFMTERENIRKLKLAGAAWPWTDNKILQTYKFTNVKREHDRTSNAFIEEFYKPNFNAPREEILLNAAIARYFGTIEFMRAVGWQTRFNPRHLIKVAADRMKKGQTVWTGAYIITANGMSGPKEETVVEVFLAGLWARRKEFTARPFTWRPVVEKLMEIQGFGGSGFMSKESVLDTRHTSFWPEPPEDRFTWTPVGPGGMRGAARILGYTDKRLLSKQATVDVCLELFKVRKQYLPADFVELELHDLQWILCEFDKMERVRLGQGRPRAKYRVPTK